MSAVDVSVVVPTRDRPGLLRQSVRSALRQESVRLEVIVVDDAGAERAAEALTDLDDRRVRLIRHPEQRGVAAARNTAIAAASGEWVAFLDDDDLWAPAKLRAQLDAASERDAQLVYGTALMFDELVRSTVVLAVPPPDDLERALHVSCSFGPPSCVMVRTDVARAVGGFDERFSVLADWDMWLRTSARARAAACAEVVVGYRRHARNMSAEWARETMGEFELLRELHGARAAAHGVAFDEAGVRTWIAEEELRTGRHLRASLTYLRGWLAHRERGFLSYALRAPLGPRALSLRRRPRDSYDLPEWLVAAL